MPVIKQCLFQDYSNLDSFSLVEVLDLIESTRETVDDVWKQNEHAPYPETRMIRLMDVIGAHQALISNNENTFVKVLMTFLMYMCSQAELSAGSYRGS